MKSVIFILFFVSGWIYGYSQYVYYGYPINNVALEKGDIVILNIPSFSTSNCKFINIEDISKLIELLKNNDANKLRIEMNCFYTGDSLMNESVSGILCNDLKQILELNTTLTNYYIVSNGSKNPISCKNEDSWTYVYINSRIEIIVE